jgi:hypothetical protein
MGRERPLRGDVANFAYRGGSWWGSGVIFALARRRRFFVCTHACRRGSGAWWRGGTYYDVLDFHKTHTIGYPALQQQIGLVTALDAWYSEISSIIYGQLPGVWSGQGDLSKTAHNSEVQDAATKAFEDGTQLVHRLFLCTVGPELWEFFSHSAKPKLLAGLDGKFKQLLDLDPA